METFANKYSVTLSRLIFKDDSISIVGRNIDRFYIHRRGLGFAAECM